MSIRTSHVVAILAVMACVALMRNVGTTKPADGVSESDRRDQAAIVTERNGFEEGVKPFFKTYCIKCHGPEESKGDISVHSLNGDLSLGQNLDEWESILDMLEFGEMPPINEPQPKAEEVNAVEQWIESGMRDYIKKANQEAPEPKTRRLTNVEYENTLSELLGFEIKVLDDLPKDPEHHYHFNNTAELMRIGPEQLDEYLRIARRVMRSAIVAPEEPEVFKVRHAFHPSGTDRGLGSDEINPIMGSPRHKPSRGFNLWGPSHGKYRVRMSASALPMQGRDGVWLKVKMGMSLNGDHNEKPYIDAASFYLTNSPDEPRVYEFTGRLESVPFSMEKGKDGSLAPARRIWPLPPFDDGTLTDGVYSPHLRKIATHRAVIHWIEAEAPVFDVWPPKHHTDILFESPLRETDEQTYVRGVLARFMSRAYRRPVTDQEVQRFVKVYGVIRPSVQTFEEAIRETLAMVLVAPRFLYHTESDPATDEHYATASRLSYFLWASMPDQELFDLAAKKQLNDPAVIERQVLRMLEDERSSRFIKDFTLQWLSIEKMQTVPINNELFPRFSRGPYITTVRDYMMQESVDFVEHLIRENMSALNVVDSDFAILNERLAIHYGVDGVKGVQMRPVPIKPEHHLGGLLTHGAVLIGNGTGTAPHPIYRAVWLREAILGDTVAPPPSEVPALEDTAGDSTEGALSIADLLAKHRTVESCNDCHFRLDPWGIPFERYNAIGKYQPKVPKDGTRVAKFDHRYYADLAAYEAYVESLNTVKVDAKARVPHGPEVDGMRDLKAYLLKERKDDIAENVIRRLLSYGIGRHLTYRDRFEVDELFEEAKGNNFKMRDIIVSICNSNVFRNSKPKKED